MGILKTLISLLVIGFFVYVGTTVQFGDHTLFRHFANIWTSTETQKMVQGVKETGAPIVKRVKRGIRVGMQEATKPTDAGMTNDGAKEAKDTLLQTQK